MSYILPDCVLTPSVYNNMQHNVPWCVCVCVCVCVCMLDVIVHDRAVLLAILDRRWCSYNTWIRSACMTGRGGGMKESATCIRVIHNVMCMQTWDVLVNMSIIEYSSNKWELYYMTVESDVLILPTSDSKGGTAYTYMTIAGWNT